MFVLAISFLLLLGIGLIIAEILILPGITVAGVGGILSLSVGLFLSYKVYGSTAGSIILILTLALLSATVLISLKSKTWKKIALTSKIEGKANTFDHLSIKPGDRGVTLSKIGPMGKVFINNQTLEAKSTGIYIEENSEIEVISVNASSIIIKPLKQ
jgi:membrane-bound ClpP family serine protease